MQGDNMPNDAVFNQMNQPLYTEQVNTFVAPAIDSPSEGGAAKAGLLFTIPFSSTVTTAAPLSTNGVSGRNNDATREVL